MRDLFGNSIKDQSRVSFRDWQIREGQVLYQSGASQMGNTHLLAHLLRDPDTARHLMDSFDSLSAIAQASVKELLTVEGVGTATAEIIKVAFELSKRLALTARDQQPIISSPRDVYNLLCGDYRGLKQEILKVLLLDTKNRVESIETICIGTLNCSLLHPREIFKPAIRQSAASIILAHNHPSGAVEPSKEDIAGNKQMVKAGELVQIPLLDHVIIGDGFCSLKEEGLM